MGSMDGTILVIRVDAEPNTFDTLKHSISPLVADGGGQWIADDKSSWLASFPSAAQAVKCAAEIQRRMSAVGQQLEPIRIAVHHAEFQDELSRAAHDDVTIALELVSIGEAGGVVLSRTVYDVVRNEIRLPYNADAGVKDWHYACAPLRMNKKHIDVVRDSAVHVPASAFAVRHAPSQFGSGRRFLLRLWRGLLHREVGAGKR